MIFASERLFTQHYHDEYRHFTNEKTDKTDRFERIANDCLQSRHNVLQQRGRNLGRSGYTER